MIKFIKHNPAVMTMQISAGATENQSLMLTSDVHYDSTLCDLPLLTKHLKLAENKNAPVLIAGDFLDVMQGHYDPRRSMDELKDKYKVSSYLDAVVMDAAAFLASFNIKHYILALGNHETGVLRNSDTNLMDRVAHELRVHYGKDAISAGYWGYLKVEFRYKKGRAMASKMLYWHHGKSTSAPVTKGVIQVARQSVYLYDVDFVLNGHNHESYTVPVQVEKINQKTMEPYTKTVWYLRTPGYKISPGESKSIYGYGPEKYRAPTPRGSMFLDMKFSKDSRNIETRIVQEIM